METLEVHPERGVHRHPLTEMLFVAAPTVVTMTSYTVMQFIDAQMVSRIGPDEVYVAAQGNGGMAAWFAMSFALGLVGVINTYVSQNLGAGTPRRAARYAWNGLWIAGLMALAMLPYAASLPWIFGSVMSHEGTLLMLEVGYGQILAYGAFLTMGSRAVAHYFYGMHKPVVVMVAALSGNVVNVLANAVLIFGAAGMPVLGEDHGAFALVLGPIAEPCRVLAESLRVEPLGVNGAAVGTILGTGFEFLLPMLIFLSPRMHARYGTRSGWRPSWRPMRDIWRIGWPGGLMFANEMVCWWYLMSQLVPMAGRAGAEVAGATPEEAASAMVIANTAGWIALRYMHVSFMPAVGLSIAVTAIVGRCLGMGRPDLAARRAWLGLGITVSYMGLCALCFVVFREQMIEQFVPSNMPPEKVEQLIAAGAAIMIAAAVFQIFDATAITLSSALRGAGDTVWPGVVTVVASWVFIVGLGLAVVKIAPGLGSLGPWIGAAAYIMFLGVAFLVRFLGGKWKTISLLEPRDGAITRPEEPLLAPAEAVAGTTPGTA